MRGGSGNGSEQGASFGSTLQRASQDAAGVERETADPSGGTDAGSPAGPRNATRFAARRAAAPSVPAAAGTNNPGAAQSDAPTAQPGSAADEPLFEATDNDAVPARNGPADTGVAADLAAWAAGLVGAPTPAAGKPQPTPDLNGSGRHAAVAEGQAVGGRRQGSTGRVAATTASATDANEPKAVGGAAVDATASSGNLSVAASAGNGPAGTFDAGAPRSADPAIAGVAAGIAGATPASMAAGTTAGTTAMSGEAAAGALISPAPGSPEFAPALGTQIVVFVRQGIEQARLQLNPAEMGPIAVQLALDGNTVRIEMIAEQGATRTLLEQSLPTLAASLRDAGFTLGGGGVFGQARDGHPGQNNLPASAPQAGPAVADLDAAGGATDMPLRVLRSQGLVDTYA